MNILPKFPQDRTPGGNYHLSMGEIMLLHDQDGMLSQSQANPKSERGCTDAESIMPPSMGQTIDWSEKLAEHDHWLRTVVLARLGERQAVDDVMQEVALAAVAQRAPLHDLARLSAWLYQVAVRQALLYRRRRGRERKLLGSYTGLHVGERPHQKSPDPFDVLLQDERRVLVREAVWKLPRRDREILLLKYSQDWSYRELAEKLGVSESAVEARLHRARTRLRETWIGIQRIEEEE